MKIKIVSDILVFKECTSLIFLTKPDDCHAGKTYGYNLGQIACAVAIYG